MAGQLPYTMIPGKYGNEYRLAHLPMPGQDIVAMTGLDKALSMIKTLQKENLRLAMELGRAEQKVLQLITAATPWWKRLFK